MKTSLVILFSCVCFSVFAQVNPRVIFATPEFIQGIGEPKDTIEISTDTDFIAEYKVEVGDNGRFKFNFPSPIAVGGNIIIWSIDPEKEISQRILVKIEEPASVLKSFSNKTLTVENFTNYTVAGKTVKYKATIWNTNFSIPLARFNFTEDNEQKVGDLLLFNSIGAGFGISAGELSETRDLKGELINQEFVNTFGVHVGFLFSAGTGDDAENVFAPTLNVSILDFQIGVGYELGTLSENQKPTFLTLSYAIPLYKLKKGGFWIWKSSTPIMSPLQSRLGE